MRRSSGALGAASRRGARRRHRIPVVQGGAPAVRGSEHWHGARQAPQVSGTVCSAGRATHQFGYKFFGSHLGVTGSPMPPSSAYFGDWPGGESEPAQLNRHWVIAAAPLIAGMDASLRLQASRLPALRVRRRQRFKGTAGGLGGESLADRCWFFTEGDPASGRGPATSAWQRPGCGGASSGGREAW